MRTRVLLLSAAALLGVAAPAAADPSPSIRLDGTGSAAGGGGREPSVVVDTGGTSRVAWFNQGGTDPLRYCVIGYAETGCRPSSPQPSLPPGGSGTGHFELLADPVVANKVWLVVARIDGKEYASSSTGDAAWTGWTQVGALSFLGAVDSSFVFGPGTTTLSFMTTRGFQASGAGPAAPAGTGIDLAGGGFSPLDSAMVVPAGGHPLAVMTDGTTGQNKWRQHKAAAPTTTVGVNTLANWDPLQDLGGGDNDETRLVTGSSGTFLLWVADVGNGFPQQLQVRKFNGAGFDPPVNIAPQAPGYGVDFYEAGSGFLYASFRRNGTGTPEDPTHLVVAKSTDGGATWSTGDVSRDDTGINDISATDIGASSLDGRGSVVFESASTDPSNSEIRLSHLDLLPPIGTGSSATTPTSTATTTTGTGPGTGPPTTTPPGKGPAANKVAQSTTVGSLQIDFLVPTACVPAGQPANMRVTSKDKKRLGGQSRFAAAAARSRRRRPKLKIKKVTFKLDRAKIVDKKKAFRASFPTTGMAPGSKHVAKALVAIKKAGKRKPLKRTMSGTITIC
jgi:hypothetical protein